MQEEKRKCRANKQLIMDKRDSIKKKIKALLAKTTENGATEAEALTALAKAKELMMENFISEHEITDPYIAETCVFRDVERKKSAYDLTMFLPHLCRLFDCKHFFTKKRVTFFGFEEDAELCVFFYEFIIKACMKEKERYVTTLDYKAASLVYSGRSLVASFIRGFLVGICLKMDEMYKCRKADLTQEMGLMVIAKEKRVEQQFNDANMKIHGMKPSNRAYETTAFQSGIEKGKDVQIVQGIAQQKKENTLMLE